MVSANKDYFSDLRELEGKLYQIQSDRTITKGYLFAVSVDNPTFITVKSSAAAEEKAAINLVLKSKVKLKRQYSPILLCIKEALLQGTLALALADMS